MNPNQDLAIRGESVAWIYEAYLGKRFIVNRRYQRKLVWSIEEKEPCFLNTPGDFRPFRQRFACLPLLYPSLQRFADKTLPVWQDLNLPRQLVG